MKRGVRACFLLMLPGLFVTGVRAYEEPEWLPLHFETLIPDRPTGGRVLHVSPQGDDGAAGSAGKPWKTLAHAFGKLGKGDTLTLADGSYAENTVFKASGDAERWIVVRAADGAKPRLCGGEGVVLRLEPGVSFVRFQGLEISRGSHGLRCDNGKPPSGAPVHDLDVIGCAFHDLRGTGIKIVNIERLLVHSCRFNRIKEGGTYLGQGDGGAKDVKLVHCKSWGHDDGQGGAGDSDGFHVEGGRRFLFEACEIQDVAEDGIDCKGGEVVVRNCRVCNAHNGLKLWSAPILVENCVIQKARENALKIAVNAEKTGDVRVRSSTFLEAGDILVVFAGIGPVGRLSIRNCVLGGGKKAIFGTWKENLTLELDADHMLYAESPHLMLTVGARIESKRWDDFVKAAGGNVSARYVANLADLRFDGLSGGKPAPKPESPAFETGDPANATATDPLGKPRAKKPSVGAF